jgi:acetate---CoA ligase (ADP-forming)
MHHADASPAATALLDEDGRATHLDAILRPRSIAVIGASRSTRTIGHQVLANLLEHGFAGTVYPVNPLASSVHSIRAYPSVLEIPEAPDLAVLAVPKERALQAARECAEAGVRGLVVITAGFREVGGEGEERERELMEIVRAHGMRMVGPNCMGVLNTEPGVSMNATFAPGMPPRGHAAFVSQSGALGLSVLDYAREYGIGISQFVSVGNKPDVSGNDLLTYWEEDDDVRVILMYVENFGNPRNFLEIASRITRHKPIIALKSGRSGVGARAAASHTGALAASDASVDALLHQAGVLRAASMEELFDMAMAFGEQPLPRSRRTVVLTNSGGPGILVADALEAHGLEVVELSPGTVEELSPLFPEEASIRNPLDMIASATPAHYRGALTGLLADDNVDAAVAIFVPPLGIRQEDVAEAIVEAARTAPDKPVLAVLMGREGLPQGRQELHAAGIPAYIFPESAARALLALNRHREWGEREASAPVELEVDSARGREIVERAAAQGRTKLTELESLHLLEAYGIATAAAEMAEGPEDAARIAQRVGTPVALKLVSQQVVHKSDVGGVRLGLSSAAEVDAAVDEMLDAVRRNVPDARVDGVLVQRMISGGTETIVGISRDPVFGPMVMFGLGGIFVEVMGDVAFRVAPFGRNEAEDLLDGIRAAAILRGVRGQPPADREALIDVLLRLSRLADDLPEVLELDANPLLARADGAIALDARVTIAG